MAGYHHHVRSRDRYVGRLTVNDNRYMEKVREILLAEPCRGFPTEPSQLLGHIYIGGQSNAESLRLLRRLGVTHVLNCAAFKGSKTKPRPTPDVSPYEGLNIDYHEFQAEDVDTYDITKHFKEAFSFLDTVERKGGVALVHCAMGVNRSAAICVAYIMHSKGWTLFKTVQLLKDKRRVVLANKGFQLQLVKFARTKGLLDKLDDANSPRERLEKLRDTNECSSTYSEDFSYKSRDQYDFDRRDRHAEDTTPLLSYGNSRTVDLLSLRINDALSVGDSSTRRRNRDFEEAPIRSRRYVVRE